MYQTRVELTFCSPWVHKDFQFSKDESERYPWPQASFIHALMKGLPLRELLHLWVQFMYITKWRHPGAKDLCAANQNSAHVFQITARAFIPDWASLVFKHEFSALWKVEQQGTAVTATWVFVPIWILYRSFVLKNVLWYRSGFPGIWRLVLALIFSYKPRTISITTGNLEGHLSQQFQMWIVARSSGKTKNKNPKNIS